MRGYIDLASGKLDLFSYNSLFFDEDDIVVFLVSASESVGIASVGDSALEDLGSRGLEQGRESGP